VKKTWIKNAITAEFYLKENKDYVVRDGLIRIVDY
jgi:preprotein translocase subunit SecA